MAPVPERATDQAPKLLCGSGLSDSLDGEPAGWMENLAIPLPTSLTGGGSSLNFSPPPEENWRRRRTGPDGSESRTSLTSKDGWMVQRECAAKQRLQAVGLHPASSESMLQEFTALEAGIFLDTSR